MSEDAAEGKEQDYYGMRFGKAAEEAEYTTEVCPFCNSRIDEFGLCACGAGGD